MSIEFDTDVERGIIRIESTVRAFERTGVETEAVTAASVAALTVYDMCKGTDRGITVVDVTRIGKECHDRCAIYKMAGDCVMPGEGIFAKVVRGGTVRPGDMLVLL